MTDHLGVRVLRQQGGCQPAQGGLLGLVELIGTDQADADGVRVVATGMGARSLQWSPFMDRAIRIDHIVIADIGPAAPTLRFWLGVPAPDALHRDVLAVGCGGTMNDEFVDSSFHAAYDGRRKEGK